jgi:hypothetical protein
MALKEKLRKRKKKVVKKVSKKASKKKEATPTKSSSKKKVVKKVDKADTPIVKNVKPKVVKGKTDQRTQDITPDWAMDKLNEAKIEVSNRHVNQRHVDLLADDMKKGRWVENGVGIVLDEEGYLIDGQHRLWAVATSGVTIRSLVVTGVNREMALPTINVNQRGRSLADVITMDPPVPGKHISNPRVLQAAVKWLHRYRHKEIFQGNKAVSTGELLELLQAEPGLIDSQHAADSLRGLSPSAGLSVWAHYIFSTRDPDLADEFIDKLATGPSQWTTSRSSSSGRGSTLRRDFRFSASSGGVVRRISVRRSRSSIWTASPRIRPSCATGCACGVRRAPKHGRESGTRRE